MFWRLHQCLAAVTHEMSPRGSGLAVSVSCGKELPLQDMCASLRDGGTPNGALRPPRIAQRRERRGEGRRGEKEAENTSRGAISPREVFTRAQQRAIEANERDETLRGMCDTSRFQARAAWKRRDVQEDVQDVQERGKERCAGSRAGGMLKEVGAKHSNSRLFW